MPCGGSRDNLDLGGLGLDITLVLKVLGVGILVAVSGQILSKTGRDEQVTWLTVSGILAVLLMLVGEIGDLLTVLRGIFGI
jgi:stage III sporulation protein AC